jgi:hypothetical protein
MGGRSVPQIEVGRRSDLVEVHLLALPIEIHRAAAEHSDELQREFALLRVQQSDEDTPDVPARLLALIDDLGERFAGFTESTEADLEDAMDRGDESIDLVFRVPPAAKEAAEALGALLDEADAGGTSRSSPARSTVCRRHRGRGPEHRLRGRAAVRRPPPAAVRAHRRRR